MATSNKVPTLGFAATIAGVVLLGFGSGGSTPVPPYTGVPDVTIMVRADDAVLTVPADDVSVRVFADDDTVRMP